MSGRDTSEGLQFGCYLGRCHHIGFIASIFVTIPDNLILRFRAVVTYGFGVEAGVVGGRDVAGLSTLPELSKCLRRLANQRGEQIFPRIGVK